MWHKLTTTELVKGALKLAEHRFFKYAVVGALSTLIDTFVLALQVELLRFDPLPAKVVSQVFAITNGYLLNRSWTFKDKTQQVSFQYLRFVVVSILGIMISLVVFAFFTEILGIWYIFANILTAFVVLIWNFNINRIFTFK